MAVASLIVMRDHGLLGRKQSIFYIVSAAAIAAAVLLRTYAGGSLLDAIAEALFVSFISNLFLFPRPIKEWCSALAAPCITLTVFALLGFCVLQVQLFWHSEAGFSQVLNVGIVAVIVMLVSVVLSVSARRLPLKTKPIVVVPQVRREDRIMSEVVLDLVVGFFRFVSDSFQGVFRFLGKMLSIGLRSTMRMLLVGGTAVIPLAVQARLSYWRVRLQVGLNRLSKPWRARTSN
jgi:hypothetical protein